MSYGTIRAFVGPNGAGKTLAAVVEAAIPAWQQGRAVMANLDLYPDRLGFAKDLAGPINGWQALASAEHCTVILDEITAVLPSRGFASMPAELQRVMNQLRKADVDLCWTAPNWARCDVILREVTQDVTVCRAWGREKFQRGPEGVVRNEDGKRVRRGQRWPARKLFQWTTYDAQMYDDYTDRRADQSFRPKFRRWYYRPWHVDQWAYETLAPVALLDHLDDLGRCVHCGKGKKKTYCNCVAAPEGAPAPEAAPL